MRRKRGGGGGTGDFVDGGDSPDGRFLNDAPLELLVFQNHVSEGGRRVPRSDRVGPDSISSPLARQVLGQLVQ